MTAPMVDYKIHWLKMMFVPESRAVVGRHDGINGRDTCSRTSSNPPQADGKPEMIDGAQVFFRTATRKHPATVRPARQGFENVDCHGRQGRPMRWRVAVGPSTQPAFNSLIRSGPAAQQAKIFPLSPFSRSFRGQVAEFGVIAAPGCRECRVLRKRLAPRHRPRKMLGRLRPLPRFTDHGIIYDKPLSRTPR